MNDKQLDRMAKLVQLKVEMAKMGGSKPFDEVSGFIDEDLKALVKEINDEGVRDRPGVKSDANPKPAIREIPAATLVHEESEVRR